MFDLILSIIVLAAIALAIGAYVMWRKGMNRQAMLMAILSFIMIANVAVWVIPMESGESPADVVAGEEAGQG
ncbi:hypothetical protein OZN62_04310 [Aurantiacibacter sp. MUD11]|uniref:hypothetical protein n=1 Tax=Aurantiacibacter sp. MUD11 TaxID=3003265 RepID=UPI0022AA2329|nr:hypothetical protein [Aurantiacibacter sp. MUD11]WAT18799.1 hypothetical protein OZN62_04310 [Aurantiacibacter sp. MUD11]